VTAARTNSPPPELAAIDVWLRHRIDETQSQLQHEVGRSNLENAALRGRIAAYRDVRFELADLARLDRPSSRWARFAAFRLNRIFPYRANAREIVERELQMPAVPNPACHQEEKDNEQTADHEHLQSLF